jgi:hypothetical protein
VLTRLGWVTEHEIPHIAAHDRGYVAAEMHAFLFGWLSHIPCRVLNRPTAYCLAGPSWRPEKWLHAAARLGIPTRRMQHLTRPGSSPQAGCASEAGITVTIVGDRSIGDRRFAEATRELAAAAGVEMLIECRWRMPTPAREILLRDHFEKQHGSEFSALLAMLA